MYLIRLKIQVLCKEVFLSLHNNMLLNYFFYSGYLKTDIIIENSTYIFHNHYRVHRMNSEEEKVKLPLIL